VETESEMPLPGPTGTPAVSCAAWSPAGDLLAVATASGVRLHPFPAGEAVRTVEHAGPITALAFDRSGRRLALAGQTTRVWDLEKDEFATPPLALPFAAAALTFSPSGEYLAAAGTDGLAHVFDLKE